MVRNEKIEIGIVRVHHRGFGFVGDIFIPKNALNGAVDGDTVEVSVIKGPKGLDGRVLEVIKRGRKHLAGTIYEMDGKDGWAFIPLLGPDELLHIPAGQGQKCKVGDRVIVQVERWQDKESAPEGKIVRHLGHISDPSCDVDASIEEYGIDAIFPQAVLEEIKAFGQRVSATEMKGREDFREHECFTIDPESAKDFDDAITISQDKKGHFHLIVHIADVSHYVKPGTALDAEARRRCNSTYFPGEVVPMLPHELSSHLCSLMPNVNRLTLSVIIELDPEGQVLHSKVVRGVIKSQMRFSYEEAKEVLEGNKDSKFKKSLFLMVDLCHRLKQQRAKRGSIEFSLPDTKLDVSKAGEPTSIDLVEYDITHQMIEEFMLLANQIVATKLSKEAKPLAYRIHEEPNPEKIKDFAATATALGFKVSAEPDSGELQHLFDEAKGSPFGQFLATCFIRSMKLASYSTQNIGHFGLGLEHYTHFTSPIRRYIDLMVHRLLFEKADPKCDYEAIALQCSEKERLSAKAEGAVLRLKKLRLLEKITKKDPHHRFSAVVTSIKPFGFAFELEEFLLEGFLHLWQTDRDYFVYDSQQRKLRGKHEKLELHTGDRIVVILEEVDLITCETNWQWVE